MFSPNLRVGETVHIVNDEELMMFCEIYDFKLHVANYASKMAEIISIPSESQSLGVEVMTHDGYIGLIPFAALVYVDGNVGSNFNNFENELNFESQSTIDNEEFLVYQLAALTIQKWYRGCLLAKKLKYLMLEREKREIENLAAFKIQTNFFHFNLLKKKKRRNKFERERGDSRCDDKLEEDVNNFDEILARELAGMVIGLFVIKWIKRRRKKEMIVKEEEEIVREIAGEQINRWLMMRQKSKQQHDDDKMVDGDGDIDGKLREIRREKMRDLIYHHPIFLSKSELITILGERKKK